MPYEVSFTKRVEVADPESYFNTCCYGGDVVSARLLPAIQKRYEAIQANQEDWGWFIWFRSGAERMAVDIFCDDPATGAFRIHLTSRVPRFLFRDSIVDTPALEDLKVLVSNELTEWIGSRPRLATLDAKQM